MVKFVNTLISLGLIFSFINVNTQGFTNLDSVSSCLGNCIQCEQNNPNICKFQNSISDPNQNFYCMNYYSGKSCQNFSKGFNIINESLEGWQDINSNPLSRTSCPVGFGQVQSLGQFQNITIQKRIQAPFQNTDSLVIEFGLFIKFIKQETDFNETNTNNDETNIPSIDTIINEGINELTISQPTINQQITLIQNGFRYFLRNFNVSINGLNWNTLYTLRYEFKQVNIPQSHTCGKYYQFITQALPLGRSQFQNFTIQISSIGAERTSWALHKFKVSTGCSSFMIYSPSQGCNYCQSGFYAQRNSDQTLSQCMICPQKCETCLSNMQCISCSEVIPYAKIEENCSIENYYTRIQINNLTSGRQFTPQQNDQSFGLFKNYFVSLNNKLQFKGLLESNQKYNIEFYLLYLNSYVDQSNLQFQVYVNEKAVGTIDSLQLTRVSGLYQSELFSVNNQKIYSQKVVYQNISQQEKQIQILMNTTNNQFGQFAITNLVIYQQKCPQNCDSCNINNGTCTSCNSFFSLQSNCYQCPNGMFIKPASDLNQCVKCHSTCKQCSGPLITQCTQCFQPFELQEIQYNEQCIQCVHNDFLNLQNQEKCKQCVTLDKYQTVESCLICFTAFGNFEDLFNDDTCNECWFQTKFAYSRCVPKVQSGYRFYGADILGGYVNKEAWNSSSSLENKNLTKQYIDIWGISNKSKSPEIQWSADTFPSHTGMIILFNLFVTDIRQDTKVQITHLNGDIKKDIDILDINNTSGANIDSNSGNQMIYSYVYRSNDHIATNNISFKVKSNKEVGLYLRQLQVYLRNCDECLLEQLNYQIGYIPRYLYEGNEIQGLDIWVEFSQPLNNPEQDWENTFQFSFLERPNMTLKATQFLNQLEFNNRLKYFIPLRMTFVNYTLLVNTSDNQRIFARKQNGSSQNLRRMLTRILLVNKLNTAQTQTPIHRYSTLNKDDSISVNQLYWFFRFFQWFTLIVMIICALLGVGVIFEDFSIMLQILFLHVYISSNLLPATYKGPMWGLQRMQNLNYFSDTDMMNIQNQWFGQGFIYPSPFVFQQYNIDIYFARSFYPTIIINLVYLGWFILLLVVHKFVKAFKNSTSIVATFFKSIPERPINYFDQIWRYQFLTTCWATFIQFSNLDARDGKERTVIALCFISFIISVIWPIFVIIYTYKRTFISYTTNFLYYYQDIFFKKTQTFGEESWKYYLYIAIRFSRLLGIALFISLFTNHQLVGPIVLIFLNIIEIVYITQLRIFVNDIVAMVFKVSENILFIFIEIALLIVYGTSNTMAQRQFLNLGYAIIVLYVIMIVLAFARFIYYAYSKFRNYKLNAYDLDGGKKKEYKMTPLPNKD